MRLVFDIETNGLIPEVHTVHCICVRDVDTDQEWRFVNRKYRSPSDGTIEDGLELLDSATLIIGHNIKTYDLVVLSLIYNWTPKAEVHDTYIESMLAFPALKSMDFRLNKWRCRKNMMPLTAGYMVGSHTLKAWGQRLGCHKGDYGDNRKDWSVFDSAMLRYCMQDVRVNHVAFNRLAQENVPYEAFQMEMKFALVMHLQQMHGFHFDVAGAEKLTATLQIERAKLHATLDSLFPPRQVHYLTKVKKLPRTKEIVFNPGSRDQIAWNLTNKYGWEPKAFTDGNKPKVDDEILGALPYPEAQLLARALMLGKRLGAVSDGKGAWLKKVGEDGRIHGRVVNIGTPHGRCAHSNPNMAQVPNSDSEYGEECRSLFGAPDDKVIVGCDASGIQLRGLAHYLSFYDGGQYVEAVTHGDPHSKNQKAAGIATRPLAKTFIYAFLFGMGNEKLGWKLGGAAPEGKLAKNKLYANIVGLRDLVDDITERLKDNFGVLTGFDGRVVPCPSLHVGLNYLLTSFEIAVMKLATVILHEELAPSAGLVFGEHYANVAHVHDEYQFECDRDKATTLGECARQAIILAGERLGSQCPLDGEYKIGATWAETH